MTEKRFKSVRIDDEVSYIVIDGIQCYIDTGDDLIVENKLNELSEENEQLKQQLKTKVIVNRQYEELQKLKKENEKLKQFIDDLTTEGTGRIDLANGYSYNVNVLLTNIKGDD